ncbi:SPOSA6832_00018 [Sporobolomyces salmonicolor]|uniref:SPOSA6832_00018-mRNA-1:cds n=1 Tax=Sporidiobolus salmonicolor TaxID=5005 RepID=A0A0D6EFJ8_SPOSA|nr:SPOSA6832_00018 [Sporobolomyces salmonicolor]
MPGLKSPSPTKRASPNKGKGKQRASTTAASPSASSPRSTKHDDNELLDLAERIVDQAHLLVRGKGSGELEKLAREVTKRSFDRALQSESLSFPHLATLLSSLVPASGPSTRSSTTAVAASADDAEPPFSLNPTPIPELTIDGGMDAEMIWDQMELRGQTVDGLLDEMFGEGDEEGEGEGEDGEFDDEESEGEEMDGLGMGREGDEGEEGSDDGDEEEEGEEGDLEGFGGEEDGEEEGDEPYYRRLGDGKEEGLASDDTLLGQGEADPLADETKGLNLDNFDGEGKGGKRARSSRRAPGPPSAVDDDFFSLHDFHVDADEGEYEMAKMLKGEADDEDDDDEGEGDGGVDLFAPVGGMGGEGDSEEEEEEDLDAAGVMYKDFFDPPPRPLKKSKPTPSSPKKSAPPTAAAAVEKAKDALAKRGVRFSDAVKVKTIPSRHDLKKGKGKALTEEELEEELVEELVDGSDEEEEGSDEEMDGMEGMDVDGFEDGDEGMPLEMDEAEEGSGEEGSEEGSEEDEGQETIERFKSSLFEEDEEDQDESAAKNLSRYERRLLALSSQIAALEAENVGPKDWATMGEAKSRDRPVNSLLDEDLEFERMGKTAPVVTEETTKGIEDLIKKRILDNQFDDVERRRPVDPNAFLPSRYLELQDSQSQKSLAEIYAEEYEQTREKEQGREVAHALDKDLEKKHQEIEELFEELAGKLDALSNARFTPKAPKATITTVSNLPSVSIESALPTTHSTSTLLAPEEVYQPSSTLTAADKSTLTPAQKKALRQKERGERKAVHDRVERVKEAKLKRRGVKGEKEKAAQMLIGTKGVTVIGKGGKEDKGAAAGGKKRKRGDADGAAANTQTSVALKL